MKIVPMPPKAPAKPVTESARDRRPGAADRTTAARADRVELSTVAAALVQLERIEPPAETPRPRLEALKAAVKSGTLQVDDEALADSIVNEDLSWPSSSGGERPLKGL